MPPPAEGDTNNGPGRHSNPRLKPEDRPFRKSDGGRLFVEVKPNGSKLWRMAYRHDGKQKLLSFGPYPAVTLADARRKRDAAKTVLAAGEGPSKKAQEEKYQQHLESISTFDAVARELLEKDEQEQKAQRP